MPLETSRDDVERLFEAFGSHVYRTALAVTRDPGAADDVTQEVFVTLLRRETPLGSNERRYLTRMTVNRSLNLLRDSKLRKEREENPPTRSIELDTSDTDLEGLRTTLDTLEDRWRIPLVMKFFGGLKLEEISEELSLPTSTVHSRIERGLTSMRERLVAQGLGALVPMMDLGLTRLSTAGVRCSEGFLEEVVQGLSPVRPWSPLLKTAGAGALALVLMVGAALVWMPLRVEAWAQGAGSLAQDATQSLGAFMSGLVPGSTDPLHMSMGELHDAPVDPSKTSMGSGGKRGSSQPHLVVTDLPNRTRSDMTATLDNAQGAGEKSLGIPLIRHGSGILVTHLPPIAHAGEDATVSGVHGVGRVLLDGSASEDPDGTLEQFLWLEKGSPIAHGERAELSMTPGIHEITLQVFDGGSPPLSDSDSVVIRVLAPGEGNAPPVADAGPDLTVPDVGGDGFEFVELKGSGSQDDGGIATWEWLVEGQSAGFGERLRLRLAAGKHRVTLRVADGGDPALRDTDEVLVTVGGENQAPDFGIACPDSITADDTGFALVVCNPLEIWDDTEEPTALEYLWLWNDADGQPRTIQGATAEISLPVGSHKITLRVTDHGSPPMTGQEECTVEVTPFGNSPPQPAWDDSTLHTAGADGMALIEANASASVDPNGDAMVDYLWELVSGNSLVPLGAGPTSSFTLPLGTHSVKLSILDAGTPALTGSRVFQVTVQPRSNAPPTARLTTPGSVQAPDGSPTATVRLDASTSTDPDGDALAEYRWILVTGSVQTLLHAGPESAIDAEIPLGIHQIRLQVEDSMSPALVGETSSTLIVSSAGNDPPVALLGTYTALDYMGDPVYSFSVYGQSAVSDVGNQYDWRSFVLVSGSVDPDGDTLTYRWECTNQNVTNYLASTTNSVRWSTPEGTWPMRLTVTDPQGASSTLEFTVTITHRP